MIKMVIVHIILSIALTNSWPLHQLDVENAFLNGKLDKELYMVQPPGFMFGQNLVN